MTLQQPKRRLKGIELSGVHVVDQPDNPGARIALFKRAAEEALSKGVPSFDQINERDAIKGLLAEAYALTDHYLLSLDAAIFDGPTEGEDVKAKIRQNTEQFKAALDALVGSYVGGTGEAALAETGAGITDEALIEKRRSRMAGTTTGALADVMDYFRKQYGGSDLTTNNTPTPEIQTRQEAEQVFKAIAKSRFPGAGSDELAVGRFAQTGEGKELYGAMKGLPSVPAAPVPVEKNDAPETTTGAGRELEKEAREIAKRENVSYEQALGRAAGQRPDLLGAHNAQMRR